MRRFLFLACASLLCLSSFVSAEPPIEVIYWQSSDVKSPSQDEIDSLREAMEEVQSFFASEMERHGFGPKTFAFNPEITVIKGKRKAAQYTESSVFVDETPLIERGLDNQIWVIFFGGSETVAGSSGFSQGQCLAPPEQWVYCNNLVVVAIGHPEITLPLLAHELGHAFGITWHSEKRMILDKIDLMSHGITFFPGVREELSKYALLREHASIFNEGGRLAIQEEPQVLAQEIDADVNDDGYVDLYDVLIVRSGMNKPVKYDTDINNDGVTDENDLAIVKVKAMEAIIAASPRKRKVKITTWGNLKRK